MLLYVNDILIASFDKDHVNKLKAVLSSEFEMNDLGDAKKILGMEIIRNKERRELWVSHEVYLWNVLSDFEMDQPKSVATSMRAHFHLKSAQIRSGRDMRSRCGACHTRVLWGVSCTQWWVRVLI